MSSLAELTSILRKKDSEKSSINEEIHQLQQYADQGYWFKLRISLGDIKLNKEKLPREMLSSCQLKISPEDSCNAEGLASFMAGEEKIALLKNREVQSQLVVELLDVNGETTPYTGDVPLSDIIDDTGLQATIEAKDEAENVLEIGIKISLDPIGALVESKMKSLKEIEDEMAQIGEKVRKSSQEVKSEASKPSHAHDKKKHSAAGKHKKVHGKSVSFDGKGSKGKSDGEVASPPQVSLFSTIYQSLIGFSMAGLFGLFQHRAIVLFGGAVAGIYFYGQEISV